jgi:Tuberculosis necrotizing toxin/Bacterial EndoU nuclease
LWVRSRETSHSVSFFQEDFGERGKGNEKGLQAVYTKYGLKLSEQYPPCEGVWGVDEIRAPRIGERFDRFQYGDKITGSYASPLAENGSNYTIPSRALIENYFDPLASGLKYGDYQYFVFEVVKPDGILFEYGEAMPWFDKTGGATQIKSSSKFDEMLANKTIIIKEKYKFNLTTNAWEKLNDVASLAVKIDNLGLTALKTEINLLDDVAKSKFLDEFAGASDDVLRAFNSETDLVSVWKNVKYLKNEAKSVEFLQWLKKATDSHLPIHLKGEVNQLNNAVGCHLQSAVDGNRVKILPNPPAIYNGIELIQAKIEIDGVAKNALSTFFPKSWNEVRVLEEVALIMKKPTNQVGNNIRKFQGVATDGVTKIEIRLAGPEGSLNFDTVFPY